MLTANYVNSYQNHSQAPSSLPRLASRAAVAIDSAILKGEIPARLETVDLDCVHELGGLLYSPIDEVQSIPSVSALANPGTETIVSLAFSSLGKKDIKTRSDLESELKNIALKLREIMPTDARDCLIEMRDFCSSLALSAATYRSTILQNPIGRKKSFIG